MRGCSRWIFAPEAQKAGPWRAALFVLAFIFVFFLSTLDGGVGGGLAFAISPRDCGWDKAKTDVERFNVLLRTHQLAVSRGENVDYTGMGVMNIEVPEKFTMIPLTDATDFKGAVINVRNNTSDNYLFKYESSCKDIQIPAKLIDSGNFTTIPALAKGMHLLVIEDQNEWAHRNGYSSQEPRCDVLMIVDGKAQNKVIQPYNNKYSAPKCIYCKADTMKKYIRNLTFNRTKDSKKMTFLMYAYCKNRYSLSNIEINTPQTELYGDRAIRIINSTNVAMSNVRINGTYSQTSHFGYGISLQNVSNIWFSRITARTDWGVFGSNNVNTATLTNCNINRFDIHSYGKDVTCTDCVFADMYNQFSSMYGTLKYTRCTFKNCTPVLLEPSYNAYTRFSLVMDDCVWNATDERNFIVDCTVKSLSKNSRNELSERYLPDVRISNLTINADDVTEVYLFGQHSILNSFRGKIGKINSISVTGVESGRCKLKTSNL